MPYIGKSPTGSGVRTRYYFTATGGETSLSGADDGGKTLTFSDGEYVDVYLNGIALVAGTDYGTATANTISGLAALSTDDIVEVVVYDIYNVAKINSEAVRTRHYYTATGGETSIGTAQIPGLSFPGGTEIEVSLNGISLVAGTDYNTTAANTVGGLSALSAGQVVEIIIYDKFQLADTVSKAQGGNFGGAIGVGTIKEATGTNTAMTIDSTGRILTPARPAFCVRWSASQTGLSATGYNRLNFDSELFDVGSNVSGAVFTAPVSGIYQFNLSQRFDGIGAGYVIFGLSDDGSTHNASSILWNNSYRISGAPASNFETLQSSLIFELTAGDDVAPWYYNSSDTSYSLAMTGSQFSGFLVG